MCEFEGEFDSTKFSRAMISNAFELAQGVYRLEAPMIFISRNIDEINIAKFDADYQANVKAVTALSLPAVKGWKANRDAAINELNEYYHTKRLELEAFKADVPVMLRQFNAQDSCTRYYSESLIAGGDSLMAAWKTITADLASKNADPQMVWIRYNQDQKNPERLKLARIVILEFGWWNCANSHIHYADSQKMYKDIEKLFLSIKMINCDD